MEMLPAYVDLIASVTQIGVLLLTALLIRESYLLRVRHESPEVICYLQAATDGTPTINFVVENVGLATARQIRFRIAGGQDWWDGRGIRLHAEFLDRGIPALAPGARIVTSFGNWIQLFKNKTRYSIRLETSFFGTGGRSFENTSYLDPWMFVGTSVARNRAEHEAVDALKKIERTLSDWSLHPGTLSIRTLNAHDNQIEQEERERFYDQQWSEFQKDTAESGPKAHP